MSSVSRAVFRTVAELCLQRKELGPGWTDQSACFFPISPVEGVSVLAQKVHQLGEVAGPGVAPDSAQEALHSRALDF